MVFDLLMQLEDQHLTAHARTARTQAGRSGSTAPRSSSRSYRSPRVGKGRVHTKGSRSGKSNRGRVLPSSGKSYSNQRQQAWLSPDPKAASLSEFGGARSPSPRPPSRSHSPIVGQIPRKRNNEVSHEARVQARAIRWDRLNINAVDTAHPISMPMKAEKEQLYFHKFFLAFEDFHSYEGGQNLARLLSQIAGTGDTSAAALWIEIQRHCEVKFQSDLFFDMSSQNFPNPLVAAVCSHTLERIEDNLVDHPHISQLLTVVRTGLLSCLYPQFEPGVKTNSHTYRESHAD